MTLSFLERKPDRGLGNIRASPGDPSRNVDWILLAIVTSIAAAVLGIEVAQETSAPGDNNFEFSINGAYQLLSLAIALPYFLLLEGGSGQTLGKKLLGIQVVAADTLQPGIGPGKALLRYIGRIISGIICFLAPSSCKQLSLIHF